MFLTNGSSMFFVISLVIVWLILVLSSIQLVIFVWYLPHLGIQWFLGFFFNLHDFYKLVFQNLDVSIELKSIFCFHIVLPIEHNFYILQCFLYGMKSESKMTFKIGIFSTTRMVYLSLKFVKVVDQLKTID